jgi:para-aminobenzoate synthetase / 4-amino-4-deoxychorismate lyase
MRQGARGFIVAVVSLVHDRPTVSALRVPLAGEVPSGHEALLVANDARPFALTGRWAGARALVGSAPLRTARADEDPFALLAASGIAPSDAPPGFVGGGWVGFLGFALGRGLEALAPSPPTRETLPPFALAWYDHLLRLDSDGRWWFEALWTAERAPMLELRLTLLRERLEAGVETPGEARTEPWHAHPSPVGHGRAVDACRERIAAGDLYQANLSLRLRSRLRGRAVDLFASAAAALAPDRAAFLGDLRSERVSGQGGAGNGSLGGEAEVAIASLSPELFLERRAERVRSAPIKGTRPRPEDPARSAAERDALAASSKDRAENVMIVDLVRNDLGRVCEPGSVDVTTLAESRAHPGVWHLVSEVEGRLADGVNDADLLRAAFPPGSVTGAPKLAALDVIFELESAARQAFTGAIGFASPVAGLELSVTIRTFEVHGDQVWLDVGGGIVADSDPAGEAAEALTKARPLLQAIGGRLVEDADGRRGATGVAAGSEHSGVAAAIEGRLPRPRRLGPRPVPRPDPAGGVFETLLVRDGQPVAVDEHLDRLAASAARLYGLALDRAALEVTVRERAAAAGGPCRARVLLGPDGEPTVETAPLPDAAAALTLEPVMVPGGLGAHKWRDRRLVDALAAAVAPATPLLVDLDGELLEASWGNVFLVDADGTLATPPLDGRILPGVTRARTLARARALDIPVAERPLRLAEFGRAREVLLTSALREVVPVGEPGLVGRALH